MIRCPVPTRIRMIALYNYLYTKCNRPGCERCACFVTASSAIFPVRPRLPNGMNPIARLVVLAFAALLLPLPGSAQPPARDAPPSEKCSALVTGDIYGRIVDARTCSPMPYANVIVRGTTLGAMTDVDGKYRIRNVPPGEQHVRAMMMTFSSIEAMVTVTEHESVQADFVLDPKWVDRVYPKPPTPANVCAEHLEQMRWVLVYTSFGCPIVQGFDVAPFPNAWPRIQGDAFKVGWGESCPTCVRGLNAEKSGQRWTGLPRSAVRWDAYGIRGMVAFKAPRGLRHSVVLDACRREGVWKGRNLKVEVRRAGPWHGNQGVALTNSYAVEDVVGDCRAEIRVYEEGKTVRMIAWLASTTNSIDDLEISIVASGHDANRIARTILGTMRFPEPD